MRLIFTISFLSIVNLCFSQINALMDFSRFKADDTTSILELYLGVDANSLKMVKNNNGKYQGSVYVAITASDTKGIRLANKYSILSPEFETEGNNARFIVQKRLLLNNNDYNIAIDLKDENATDSVFSAIIPLKADFPKEFVSISDFQLLESYEKTTTEDDYSKNGFKLISNLTDFYHKDMNKLKFYVELYNTHKQFGDNKPFAVQIAIKDDKGQIPNNLGRFLKYNAKPANVVISEFDLSQLKSGNYQLYIDIRDTENKVIAYNSKAFQRSNPEFDKQMAIDTNRVYSYKGTFVEEIPQTKISYFLKSLQPISHKNEYEFILAIVKKNDEEQMRNYFYSFWKKRSETNPQGEWNQYLDRLLTAEKKYSTARFMAHETDRGRVYLQYGKPYRVENEMSDRRRDVYENSSPVPYEVWYYAKIGGQNNRIFCFVQQDLANNNYRLVNSDANGEVNNPGWRNQYLNRSKNIDRDDIQQNNLRSK
jgi:GWxTD domain-containing protein